MGNHEIPCNYCGRDMRGLSGVKGCDTHTNAKKCSNYDQDVAEKYVEHQIWWYRKHRNEEYEDK